MITLAGKDIWACNIKDGLASSTCLGWMSLLGQDGRRRSHCESVSLFFDTHPVTAAFSYVQTAQSPCSHSSLPHVCKGTFWCLWPITFVVVDGVQTATDGSQLGYVGCWCRFSSLWLHSRCPLWFTTVWQFTLASVIGRLHLYRSQLRMFFCLVLQGQCNSEPVKIRSCCQALPGSLLTSLTHSKVK